MSDPVQEALPPLPYRVWNDSDFGDVYTAEQMREYANAAIEQLRAEVDEQARLNGMGSEREARLMAEVSEYREQADWATREYDRILLEARDLNTRAEKAEAEAAQLRAEKEAAERNERRYLWLRKNCKREWESDMPHDKGAPSLDIDFSAPGHDLDAAIDEAMGVRLLVVEGGE